MGVVVGGCDAFEPCQAGDAVRAFSIESACRCRRLLAAIPMMGKLATVTVLDRDCGEL